MTRSMRKPLPGREGEGVGAIAQQSLAQPFSQSLLGSLRSPPTPNPSLEREGRRI